MSTVNDIAASNRIVLEGQSENQKEYLRSLAQPCQTFSIGPAGTGKTFLAASYGLRSLLRGEFDKIIITRPAVSCGDEEHGFLPGTLEEKLAPWVAPVQEVIKSYLSKDRAEKMVKNEEIEFVPFTHIRGRTFNNSFIILDEAQNCTVAQMKTFLTRVGNNSKLVVNGDLQQVDLQSPSGLSWAVRKIKEHRLPVDVIRFNIEDVRRSEQCKMWLQVFDENSCGPDIQEVGFLQTKAA